ncbi:DUF4234 domain-containing protein [Yinghuangia soli]|uniref:DUF4234 domain-containing protein n=1 Tax=Yinghuangia soli TaxID=2908204 RepID=A0AA41Q124_9ACTN|nr:DUF4234 domain-containing protein [Yinghuangia soli]MCF2529533.1 DUF4234 domain-containing protein [Yinghuangia soli]
MNHQQQPMNYPQPGYQQPMGYGAPVIGKTRSPWGTWGLMLATLGIYGLVWYYKINREIRDFARVEVSPGVAVLAMFPGGYIIVPPFISLANTAGRVRQAQAVGGRQQDCGGGMVILLAILMATHMPYIQRRLNDVWAMYGGGQHH